MVMAPVSGPPSHLTNPLASIEQLQISASQVAGVPKELEDLVRCQSARLLQAAGVLLRLPQEIIAKAIVVFYRALLGSEGVNLLERHPKDVAAACLYLTAKPSAYPLSPRSLLIVIECLTRTSLNTADQVSDPWSGKEWYFSEGNYAAARNRLYAAESHVLKVIGFQTHCALPYALCINYLQTLEMFQSGLGNQVAKQAFALLNTALLSPQLLYLTHQPPALATAAVYLAARQVNAKLPEVDWWTVFDVDREELGFLVVAMLSVDGYVAKEAHIWGHRTPPLTSTELEQEINDARAR